jgi:hypothetical protein
LEPGPDGLKVHGYEVQAYGRPSVAEESPVRRPVRRQAGPRQSVWQALVNRLGVAVVVMFFPPTFGTGTPPVDTPNIPEMPVPTLPPPGGVDTPPPGGVTPPPPPPPSGGPTPTPPPVNSAPEPSTFATGLLGSALVGLVLLGGLRKRRL